MKCICFYCNFALPTHDSGERKLQQGGTLKKARIIQRMKEGLVEPPVFNLLQKDAQILVMPKPPKIQNAKSV